METGKRAPTLVGTTADTYRCSITESQLRERIAIDALPPGSTASSPVSKHQTSTAQDENETNYFKSTEWTPDGTTLFTSSADNTIRTFIVPSTLLDSPTAPTPLLPYTTHTFPCPINCLAPYPFFTLSSPTTTLYLSSISALPIRLCNALSPSPAPVATYSLICPTTEAYLTPVSLLWSPSSPSTFLTGTDSLVALFDVSRTGSGPVTRLPTIPSKRHKLKGGGVGMRGIVSALSLQPASQASFEGGGEGMLAAGTYTRWIGLYDLAGLGGTVATFPISHSADTLAKIGGNGVTSTSWSSCGKYLFVAERCSRGILVYDVRVTGRLVGWLEGREAETNQRLGVDVFDGGEGGSEIWAGGTDGMVRVWEGVGMREGALERSWEWRAGDDPISSTVVHNSGTVVATTSGKRSFPVVKNSRGIDSEDESDESSSSEDDSNSSRSHVSSSISSRESSPGIPDNSLKLWSL